MAHLVRVTAVVAILWSAAAVGQAVDPSFYAWIGRLVSIVASAGI